MKPLATLVTVIALGIGALVGTAAYQVAAAPSPESVGVPVAQQESAARIVPGASFRWAPCQGQATLRRGVCVTEVVRTITPAAAPANRSAVEPDDDSPTGSQGEDDDGTVEPEVDDHASGDDDESEAHESEDDEDEDHESEDDEDEHEDGGHDD